ncbi:Chromatin modification-related protein YNG2 [Choanephora cucurbitarum]|uniref:Chromatin modification-related protein n=1 Tax=Choanephora cucurbitarum TaxID=101091 RepID=A0A1C7NIX6_9FUNG|nr:Chromatin modification-related protein YNG2 [Choanephora cucurbitarum]
MEDGITIQEDSGRYLQEYMQSLENLPSEIQYHWAEIRNRYDQAKAPEKRIRSGQHDLAKIHRQWFSGTQDPIEKRDKLLKNQPIIIKRIREDYHQLEGLADERVMLAEEALRLVDRHLSRLQKDLDQHDLEHPELAPLFPSNTPSLSSLPPPFPSTRHHGNYAISHRTYSDEEALRKKKRVQLEMKKRKKKNSDEPLYCYCQQVSYGEMVACDGEHCPYEWFHMDCVGLEEPPKGAWFCETCSAELRNKRKQSIQSITKRMKKRKDSHAQN